ncbi:MAG: GYDIA family GHMP kinase [Bacteroidota bacterium]
MSIWARFEMNSFHAHGKLLLTGEYLVLDGAKALAIPTRLGQRMEVVRSRALGLGWTSLNHEGKTWLEARLGPLADDQLQIGQEEQLRRLRQIVDAIIALRPEAQPLFRSCRITTQLEFDRHWGLGSSSTLIAMLAQYAEVSPYELLSKTFGGSGYDLACAISEGPITYQLGGDIVLPQVFPRNGVQPLSWQPGWLKQTYFVYLGKKQNSREGIHHYRQQKIGASDIEAISQLTDQLLAAVAPAEVQKILQEHETLVGQLTKQTPVQERLFPDFPGQLKSLGAWGGDFIWAISELPAEDVENYFKGKGMEVVLPYHELAL